MPSDLDQLAQDASHQDRWGTLPTGNGLQDLASQRQMTHQPDQPNPAQPYLNAARDFGQGALRFSQGGLTEVFPWLRQYMPGAVNTLGDLVQSRAARDAFSSANYGGVPLVEAVWTPKELSILKSMYGSKDFDPSLLPGRTPSVIRQKAFQLGLKRPEIPPYVRPPGAPVMQGDKEKIDQLLMMMSKQNMTMPQMAEKLGVSERTLRRYINEDLNARMRARAIWNDPKRIEQYKDLTAKGFLPQEMARRLNLPERTVYDQLRMLSRAGHLNYVPQGGARTPSLPKFSFQDEISRGDPDYEKTLLEYLGSRQ